MLPCPDAIAKVTAAPATGLPNWSFTITAGGVTAVFTVAVCWSPVETAMLPALPAVPVAVKVTGLPVRPADVALRVLAPAVVARVQLPTHAMPCASVVSFGPVVVAFAGATADGTAA